MSKHLFLELGRTYFYTVPFVLHVLDTLYNAKNTQYVVHTHYTLYMANKHCISIHYTCKINTVQTIHSGIGCLGYISPERIDLERTEGGYGTPADIWSIGISIIELGKY